MSDQHLRVPAPLPVRLLFWLILGAFSVFFAEVGAGSSPFPWIEPWGLFVVLPLYGLHALFLAWVVVSPGRRVLLPTLFVAGALFGMYEAYITKVLFDPSWGGRGLAVGGLYLLQTAVLVLYWHPFMAFIIPLFFAELLLTSSGEVLGSLPARLQGRARKPVPAALIAVAVALLLSLGVAANSTSVTRAAESVLLSYAVLTVLVLAWRLAVRGTRWSLRELLPTRRQGFVVAALLALFYLVFGATLRTGSLPRTLIPHVTALAVYAVLVVLLVVNIRKSPGIPETAAQERSRSVSSTALPVFMAVLLAASVALATTKIVGLAAAVVAWVPGVGLGILLLSLAVRRALLRRAAPQPSSFAR